MSNSLVPVLHTGDVNGHPVRFFAGPDGRPHMPWHSIDDLQRAMGLPRQLRRELLRRTRSFPDGDARTVMVDGSILVIAPHAYAQGLIGAAIEAHGVPASFEGQYAQAAAGAMKVLTAGMTPEQLIAHAVAAFKNQ